MWLKMLVWLGTKKGKWVLRIFAFFIAGVVQYAYTAHAEKRAYNNGYLVAKAEYAEAVKTQYTQLTAQLNDTFKKHQELSGCAVKLRRSRRGYKARTAKQS